MIEIYVKVCCSNIMLGLNPTVTLYTAPPVLQTLQLYLTINI